MENNAIRGSDEPISSIEKQNKNRKCLNLVKLEFHNNGSLRIHIKRQNKKPCYKFSHKILF